MRRLAPFLTGLLFGACALSCAAVPAAPSSPAPHIEAAADLTSKTVALVTLSDEHPRPFCSGVWISRQRFVTAFHCVEAAEENGFIYATHDDVYAPGELHERTPLVLRLATLTATDEEHDLALMRVVGDVPPHEVARIALDTRPGEPAQAMGHSLGLWWSYSSGEVSGVRQREIHGMDILWIQSTTPISPGNSGGGLFDDRGSLLGIAHGAFTRGQNLNLFVHGQYVDAFVRRQGDRL
jgi:S1-C subfamily serine protease